MRNFLALFLLAIPLVSHGQSGIQMQISNLQTDKTTYSAGEEITGTFVLNNIGESSIPDVQYVVAVGTHGEPGGILENETAVSDPLEPIYLPVGARTVVPFSITPKALPPEDIGLHVIATQKNGMVLGWSKIPLTYQGDVSGAVTQIIEGYFALDGQQYNLDSNAPFAEDESAAFYIELPEGTEDGTKDVKLTVYDKNVGQDVVFDDTISVDFTDGTGVVMLPEALKPKTYAAQVALVEGSNVLSLMYTITGPQAEVLEVNSNILSPKRNENFVLSLTYADTPLNARDPEATEYPENLTARIKVLNEEGEIVSEHVQPLEVTKKPELLRVNEDSTEEEQEEATKRLTVMLENERTVEIPLVAQKGADNLTFEVELYDGQTGYVYDTYKTTFPSTEREYPVRAILLATFAALLILLVLAVKAAKHKIPMVCIALMLAAGALVHSFVGVADAREAKFVQGWLNSHDFSVAAPLSSAVTGYNQNIAIPLDVKVTGQSWPSNGFLAHYLRFPIYTSGWSGFTNADSAYQFAKNNFKNENVFSTELFNGTFNKSFSRSYYYAADGSSASAPRLSPGMHYIPITSRFCTASHGCSGESFYVWEMCVNGAGVCPGETIQQDQCPYINGAADPTVQSSVPSGYVKVGSDCRNNCASNYGQACGCPGNMGTYDCDGNCSVSTSCSSLVVSCSASPSSISSNQNVTFTGTASGNTGSVTYTWPDGSTGSTWTRYTTKDNTLVDVVGTDSSGSDDGSCAVNFSEICPSETRPDSCSTCDTATGNWVGSCAQTDIVVDEFSFSPNIVQTGETCKLNLEAENVLACQLIRSSNLDIEGPYNGTAGIIDISSTDGSPVNVPIGTYKLQCKGIDAGDTFGFVPGISSKQCIGLPNVIEN